MFDHNNSSLAEIGTLIRDAKSVVIISHVRPDGDAVGTQIALGASLQELGKEVILINEDGCPSNLKFLAGSDKVFIASRESYRCRFMLLLLIQQIMKDSGGGVSKR